MNASFPVPIARRTSASLVALALAASAHALSASAASAHAIDANATCAHTGDRKLVTSGIVDATPHELWQAFTVDREIVKWMVPVAHMDLKIGGTLETSYDEHAKIGDAKNIRHTILSYEPDRMLSFTFTMPAMFKKAHDENGHWVVVDLEPLSANKTRVTETIYGWGDGEDWDKAYAFFEKGDAWTMEQLQKRFAPAEPAKPEAALDFVRKLVGGVWTCEVKKPDGGLFRAKFYYEELPDHPCFTARGWKGDEKKLAFHALTTVSRDAETGEIVQLSFLEDGSLARLTAHAKDNVLLLAGDLLGSNGKTTPLRQKLTLVDPTHLDLVIDIGPENDPKHVRIALKYERVERDPALEAAPAKTAIAR
jgi:uncharacterized protein YndB with AHSA1/START domain